MNRIVLPATVLALLVTATPAAHAQDFLSFQSTPGITRARPETSEGISTEKSLDLKEYAKVLRAVELAVNFETKRNSSHTMGPVTLSPGTKIAANVKFERENGKSVLKSLDLRPQGKMEVNGKRINRVRFKSNGEMHIDIDGLPDLKITNIRKKKNGDTVIELRGLPDITVKKDGKVKLLFFTLAELDGDFEFPEWPPNLEDLLKYAEADPEEESELDLASIVSQVSWDAKVSADPSKIDFLDGDYQLSNGDYRIDMSGQARNVGGTLQTFGDNKAKVTVELDNDPLEFGSVSVGRGNGKATLDGSYRLSMPLDGDPSKTVSFDFDGRADFDLLGRNVKVRLPKDAAISTGTAILQGGVDTKFSYSDGRPSIKLDNGQYRAALRGPMTVQNVEIPNLQTDSTLTLDGQVELNGTLKSDGRKLENRGSLRVDATYNDERGFAGAIEDGFRNITFVGAKQTRINANIDEFVVYSDLISASRHPNYLLGTTARGSVDLDVLIEEGRYQDDKITLDLPKGPHRLSVSSQFDIENRDKEIGVNNADVQASLELGSDVSYEVRTPKVVQRFAYVKVPTLEVRSGPDATFSKLGLVKFGEKLTIVKDAVNFDGKPWFLVEGKNSNGGPIKGYIPADQTRVANEESPSLVVNGTVKKGSRLDLDLRGLNSEMDIIENIKNVLKDADGRVNANVELGPTTVSMGALRATVKRGQASLSGSTKGGVTGSVDLQDADIESGDAQADVSGNAGADIDIGEADATGTRPVRMTFSMNLNDGSSFKLNRAGETINVNGKGSHVQFTVLASIGPDGQPRIHSLEDVDATIELGNISATVLGRDMGMPGEKILRLQGGRIAIHDNGIDIFGDLSVTVRSVGDTPALSIRW